MVEILDTLRVAIKWRNAWSGDMVNVYSLQVASAEATLTDANVLDAVELWAKHIYNGSGYTAIMTNDTRHEDITVTNLSTGVPVGHVGRVPDLDGEATLNSMPYGTCPLVLFRTPVPRFVGRKYLPVTSVDVINDGRVNGTLETVVGIMANDLLDPYEAPDIMTFRYVITASDMSTLQIPTSYTLRQDFAHLDRRKPGRGS